MTRYIPLNKFQEFYKSLVEKPGASTHSAKWDRCVEHVKSKGGANAYAVCTAMLGEESFKSIDADNPQFVKELDEFMRTLGISGAGPVPNSLLAQQDLEGETRKSYIAEIKDEKEGEEHYRDLADKHPEHKKEFNSMAADEAKHKKNLENMDETTKSQTCYVVRCNGAEYARCDKKEDAVALINRLESQGTFAVLLEENVVSTSEKGSVEETGKELDEAVKDSANAETRAERKSLVDTIKDVQIKRQESTIEARGKAIKGSFKEVWGSVNKGTFKKDIRNMEMYFEYLCNLRNSGRSNMFGARPYLMHEFPELTQQEAGQILAEWMRSVSKAEKKPFKEVWKSLGHK